MAHERLQSCIDACNACAEACNRCAVACLFEPNRHDLARCIQLDMDCAEICHLTAGYVSRGSELLDHVTALCNEVCEMCAAECGRHPMDHCRRCAEACRACAQQCRRVTTTRVADTRGARPGMH
jgi:hypothetical protein